MYNQNYKIYGTVTLNAKGQVVIPSEARTTLKLDAGERLVIMDAGFGDGITIVKASVVEAQLKEWSDSLKHSANPSSEVK